VHTQNKPPRIQATTETPPLTTYMNEREKPKKGKNVRAHTKQATQKKPSPRIMQKKERGKK